MVKIRVSSKEEALEIIKNKTMAFKTKYQILKDIIISHPEILLKSKQPDTAILYYLQRFKGISTELKIEEFEERMIPLSTIRNFRQNLILEFKKDGIWLDSFNKIDDKATYIKKEMRKDKKELGTFVRTGDTEWRLSK